MNTEELNKKLQSDIKNKSYTLSDTLTGAMQYADDETLDIYLQYVYANRLSNAEISVLYLFHERKILTKMHVDNIICTHPNDIVDILIDKIHLNYDNTTLIMYGTQPKQPAYYLQLIPLLDIMIKDKQVINDAGAFVVCKYLSTRFVIKYLNMFFDIGYVPSAVLIKHIIQHLNKPNNRGVISIFINEIIVKFKLLIPKEINTYCKVQNIALYSNLLTLEDKFKYYKMSCFKKDIKNDTKITQQCLYNACMLRNNVSSIKTLITKYNLKLDAKCLEISTCVPKNTKVSDYLVESGVCVSNQCVSGLSGKVYQQLSVTDALQINGIDDV